MIRRKSNRIDFLKLDSGEWIYSRNQIGDLFSARFESVFDSPLQPLSFNLSNIVNPVITEEDNADLLRIPTWEEVRNVVFSMGAFKAPGPDGMSALFYKHYWNIVGWDLVAAVRDFFMTNSMAKSLNENFIVLIPKNPSPTRPLLNRLVCPTQNAFVPERSIHDNSVLVQEAIHSMKKKKGSLGWMALKIDLEKAYDRISWFFIKELLINGAYFRDIKPKRGLRQGDPLSPYLFILCIDILSRLFLRKVESGLIHGFKLSRGGPSLHHLMFADDIFIFGKACITEASHIKETLDTFCSWLGLSFNSSKSSIFFSGNTRGAIASQLTDLLGFERIPMDSCYLGLPLFKTSKKNDFTFLVECLDTKLASWKSRLLSKASRLTLIKSVALAMPIYTMHTARIPKAICAKLDARIRRFWWGTKEENARPLCLKAWDDLCVPKAYGGLGLRRMSSMNQAIIAKWGWDLLMGKNSQCLLFLQGKYLRAGSFKSVEALPTDSTFWKAIIESRDTLLSGAYFQIGDGSSINIWEDPWVPKCRDFLPRARPNHTRDACMVKDLFSLFGHWDTRKVQSIFLPANANNILSIQLPIRPIRDYWCWLPASSGKFSARSFYLFVNKQRFAVASNIPKKVWLSVWNANILPRHKLLWWQIISNCLPTRTCLNRCFPGIDTQCPLCGQEPDSFVVGAPADLVILLLKMEENRNCGNLLLFASILFDLVWKSINEVVHGGCSSDPMSLLRQIIKAFNDTNSSLNRPSPLPAAWNPPPQDWIKFSMDAAVGVAYSCAAFVVRDHMGKLLFWRSSKILSVDPVFVETHAMLMAISWAVSQFADYYCWFESDAKTVVDSILKPSESLYWPISTISANCCVLLDYITTWHLSHAIRSRNVFAHNVARWCLLNDMSNLALPSYVLSDVKEWL
ncbi:hypothetical protein UlMin_043555 [Ulmus minor]